MTDVSLKTLEDVQAALAAVLRETPPGYAMPPPTLGGRPTQSGWSAETCLGSQVVKKLGGFIGHEDGHGFSGPYRFAATMCTPRARDFLGRIIRLNDAGKPWHDVPAALGECSEEK